MSKYDDHESDFSDDEDSTSQNSIEDNLIANSVPTETEESGIPPAVSHRATMLGYHFTTTIQELFATQFTAWAEQVRQSVKASTKPSFLFPALPVSLPQWEAARERWLATLRGRWEPQLKHTIKRITRLLLPPNLRSLSGEIGAHDVLSFLEDEAIPLYLVPRASVGRRLLTAKDHASRRKVLNDCARQITEDCELLLDKCTSPDTAAARYFVYDGIGALRAGHHASAQALFTVTLDTMVTDLIPTLADRRAMTNRRADAATRDILTDASLREAYVWLPVHNAHTQFWASKGDPVPRDFSRHATVHAVSRAQYSQRNCIQALMLVTSLIGYAEPGLATSWSDT